MGDLFVVCVFAVSFLSAYRYIHLRAKYNMDKAPKPEQRRIRQQIEDRIYSAMPCNYKSIYNLSNITISILAYA